MGYKVKVLEIDRNKKGTGANGEYTYTYMKVDYQGQESEKRIMPGTIKKFPNLKEEVAAVKVGMTVKLDTVKEGNFTNISKITIEGADDKQVTTGDTTTKSDYNDNALGQQVGNALTNAAATLGGKATVKQLEERAWEIVLIGNKLKERLKKGEHLGKVDEPPSIQDDMHSYGCMGDDGEDIPF